jgi:hypothetical protein
MRTGVAHEKAQQQTATRNNNELWQALLASFLRPLGGENMFWV